MTSLTLMSEGKWKVVVSCLLTSGTSPSCFMTNPGMSLSRPSSCGMPAAAISFFAVVPARPLTCSEGAVLGSESRP